MSSIGTRANTAPYDNEPGRAVSGVPRRTPPSAALHQGVLHPRRRALNAVANDDMMQRANASRASPADRPRGMGIDDRMARDAADDPPSRATRTIRAVRAADCRDEILARLLEPVRPSAWGGRPVLWPLWADEMIHRTYATVHLTALLVAPARAASVDWQPDYAVADNLAAAVRRLVIGRDDEALPCAAILRDSVGDLVALFGAVAGRATNEIDIQPLALPAYKRRALVLLAIELVSNVLIHAFQIPRGGHLSIALQRVTASAARLVVRDNGRGMLTAMPRHCQQISQDLADLLESEIVYRTTAFGGTTACMEFPV